MLGLHAPRREDRGLLVSSPGDVVVHIALVVSALLASLACAGTEPSELESLLAESRALREVAWDAQREASRARVRAEAARSEAAAALRAAARTEAIARSLEPAPRALRDTPLERADRVLVRKAQRRLELYREGRLLRSFRVALGFEPVGDKRHQGDGRTPEGVYTLSRQQTRRYGPGLHVSYPRAGDARRAEAAGVDPGGDIYIHGLPVGLSVIGEDHARFDWTNGCIAVTDDEMAEIWARVVDGTPIEILP